MSEMQISGGISAQGVKCPIFSDPTPLSFSRRAVRPSVRPSLLGLSTCSAVRHRRSIRPRNKSHEPHRQRKSGDVNIRSMAVSHTLRTYIRPTQRSIITSICNTCRFPTFNGGNYGAEVGLILAVFGVAN